MRSFSTDCGQSETVLLLNRLFSKIEKSTLKDPHPGLLIATHHFRSPYPQCNEISLLSLVTMDLLIQFCYPILSGYSKFTILYSIKRSYGGPPSNTINQSNSEEITFTTGSAIPLTYENADLIPKRVVYDHIYRSIMKYGEMYDTDLVTKLTIRVYMDSHNTGGQNRDGPSLTEDEREGMLLSIFEAELSEMEPIRLREIRNSKRSSYPSHITALKASRKELKPFIVADTETILINNEHKPYAAGLLLVRPGEQITDRQIYTNFSEDHSLFLDSFEERSTKVLYDLVSKIVFLVRKEKTSLTIYFHNFSRFDGILLLKHLACHHKNYKLKPLVRNHRLYEIEVYSNRKILFRLRDSLNLLPGKLSSLAKNLCPELGQKGSIPYEIINLDYLTTDKDYLLNDKKDQIYINCKEKRHRELCEYMKQDILLLGGVMQKAQEIYWNLYNVDIESKITLSSLALSIFRMKFYDDVNWPIHIPNRNEDSFIRSGYYGGHTDTYIPYGENLYYYDVNSLYPFVMKEFPMPGGKPVWHGNLVGKELDDSVFGFIKAYVECPKTIKRPFLPYRDNNNTLIFPTGKFIGVYYSEELKFARRLGYTVIPINGYLFEKMESPFKCFVSTLFESRVSARKEGNEALAYVYKILMNSLYGRFGINPKSTLTEICDENRFKHLIRKSEFISSDMLSENIYIVTYYSNTENTELWNPPKNSAVQLAAAITASARIHMYPFISKDDCYYTDTDSVVLGHPLPKDVISSSVLGQFKLEDRIMKGYFLAPKSYCYIPIEGGKTVLKYKGPAKDQVYPSWFESQYADPSRTEKVLVTSNFKVDWHTLDIRKKDTLVKIGIKLESKRIPVYQDTLWVDTEPVEVIDLSCLNDVSRKIIQSLWNETNQLLNETNQLLNENRIIKKQLVEVEQRMKAYNRDREVNVENITRLSKEDEGTDEPKQKPQKTEDDGTEPPDEQKPQKTEDLNNNKTLQEPPPD